MRRRAGAGAGLVVVLVLAGGLAAPSASAASTDQLGPHDAVRPVAAPAGGSLIGSVRRDGERLVAVQRVDGVSHVVQDDLSGAAGWVPVPGQDGAGLPTTPVVESAAGGVTVVKWGSDLLGEGDGTHVVTTSSGSWQLKNYGSAQVDQEGAYVLIDGSGGGVFEADSGTKVVDVPADVTSASIDAGLLWTVDGDGALTRRDLVRGGDPVVETHFPSCFSQSYGGLLVRGRWAAVSCSKGSGRFVTSVLDLRRVFDSLSFDDDNYSPFVLADGAVARGHLTTAAVSETGAVGPVRSVRIRSGSMLANDAGAGFVYRDLAGGIGVLDLALAGDAEADKTPPTASMGAVPAYASASSAVTLTWTGGDPSSSASPGSGINRYEVNTSTDEEVRAGLGATRGYYFAETSARASFLGTPRACYRVRAVDRRGNVGAWSDPACIQVDSSPPIVNQPSYPITSHPNHASRLVSVDYHFKAQDSGSGIASYETRFRRSTQASSNYTDWGPAKASTTATRTVTIHAGDRICFQGRAVDRAGLTSGWVGQSCTAAPYDDTLLHLRGKASVFRSSAAQGGTARNLAGSSSLSVVSGSTANCVTVRAIGTPATRAGSLRVYVAGHYRGRISPIYDTHTWANFSSDDLRSICGKGTVELRHEAGTPTVTVDSVGLVRTSDRGYELGAR